MCSAVGKEAFIIKRRLHTMRRTNSLLRLALAAALLVATIISYVRIIINDSLQEDDNDRVIDTFSHIAISTNNNIVEKQQLRDEEDHRHIRHDNNRRRLTVNAPNPANSDPSDNNNANASSSSSAYNYAVLIISYHKTGHDLQEDLVNLLINEFPPPIGPNVTAKGVKSLVRRRMHTRAHPCSRLYLQPGTVAVQHAPDFFCNAEKLAKILLEEGDARNNKNTAIDVERTTSEEEDKGVKIVHLVRNPYTMAVSNYHYHAKEPVPKPERWILRQNPCMVTYPNGELYADSVLPSLSKRSYETLNINYDGRLVTRAEFEAIANDCESIYQTRKGLESANQFQHLMNLDAPEGLRLATAELTIQGHDNGGDMLRMSNNILKLKQAEKIVQNSWMGGQNKEFQVYTLSLDDFISRPKESAMQFLNFVFDHDERDGVSVKRKEAAAAKYAQGYLDKKEGSRHITDGKSSDKEQLKEYLRHDAVFGPPMKKIERLVETALAESRSNVMLST